MEEEQEIKELNFHLGSFGGVVPILIFVIWAIIASFLGVITTNGLSMGAIIGLIVGMAICKNSGDIYAQAVFEGFTQTIAAVAIVAWFFAGMFSEVLQAGGLVEGLVWIAHITGVEGGLFVAINFLLAAAFASAVGTGYGTVVAFATLMYPAGIIMGAHPVILVASICSGAAFGDNLAPISDTTIVSAATQETDVPGVVKSRFKYAITAAIPTFILYIILGAAPQGAAGVEGTTAIIEEYADPSGLLLLIPFALVLILAFSGFHLLVSLTWGIIVGILVNVLLGLAPLSAIIHFNTQEATISGALVDGLAGYVEYAILILLIVACSHMIRLSGAMEDFREWITAKINGVIMRAELAYWAMVALLNSVITINTAAEVAAAPFVRQIGKDHHIHPYRRANFLDAQTSALGYIYPWSAGLLLAITTIRRLTNEYEFIEPISPAQVTPYVFHGWILLVIFFVAAITGIWRRYEGPNGEELMHPPNKDDDPS
ncbi:Na+/H+ antiporter NhaC family protein [Natranaerobius trueperi]|uniref:Sodium:proton antiporter n=1 Tax=Natranaerobius trueperi TaxID=759412 RepID=A0A226BYK7_9FIRM|nr:Na+/H+ antiporter NhaC family protein [Natranaerobius trueperi]OWZ83197.1 sodium:proton antiporter [Natranaerobius trueperi]